MQLAVPDDREEVAAESAEVRRDDAQREVRGDDRVDRVAAARQDAAPGRGREVVRCRDHAVRERAGDRLTHGGASLPRCDVPDAGHPPGRTSVSARDG